MTRRPDITPEEVARLWLEEGRSLDAIAARYITTVSTIRRRLAKARELYPDRPWDARKSQPTSSGIRESAKLNDGHPGESVLRSGSVVRGMRRHRT